MWDGGWWEKGSHVNFLGLVLSRIALASQVPCTSFISWSAHWVENDLKNSTEGGCGGRSVLDSFPLLWQNICQSNLKEERSVLAGNIGDFSSHSTALSLWWGRNILQEGQDREKLFASWWPKSREHLRKAPEQDIPQWVTSSNSTHP